MGLETHLKVWVERQFDLLTLFHRIEKLGESNDENILGTQLLDWVHLQFLGPDLPVLLSIEEAFRNFVLVG
jgi:hypothetical protein